MSLRVWLPLINDTHNQGLLNLPTPWDVRSRDTGGKLGQYCYSDNAIYHIENEWLGNIWSLACWVKSSGWSQYNDIILCKNTSSSDSAQFYLSIIGGTQLNIGCNAGSQTLTIGNTFATNTWYHIASTYDGSTLKLYLNGNEVGTKAYVSTQKTGMNNLGIGCRSTNAAGTSATGGANKRTNDIRIYDHCLSPLEVKEISQGLVLHYPLNNGGWGQENLVWDTHWDNIPTRWSNWGSPTVREIINTYGRKYLHVTSSDRWQGYSQNQAKRAGVGEIAAGEKITLSCWAYSNTTLTNYPCIGIHWTDGSSIISQSWPQYTITTTPQRFVTTLTIPSGNISAFNIMVGNGNSTVGGVCDIWVADVKLERGEVATSWAPNSADALAITMGLNSNRIIDCSGYGNDGQYYAYDSNGSISYTSDTPRYDMSTHIASANPTQSAASGTRYLYGHCRLTTPTQMSVAFWLKPVTGGYGGNGGSTGQGYFCTTNYEYGNSNVGSDYQASAMNHRDSAVDMNDSAGTTQCRVSFIPTLGEWHHYVYTYDGQVGRGYKDGVQIATAQFSAVKTLDSFIGVVIGFSKAGGVWRRNDACYSDFRIYATALSEADVKALYNTSLQVDNLGSMHSFEFVEDGTKSVGKNGITHTSEISEIEALKYLKYDSNIYIEPDGSAWVRLTHHNNPANARFASTDDFANSVYKDADRWFNAEVCKYVDKWEFIVEQKQQSTSTVERYRIIQTKSPFVAVWDDVKPSSANITRISSSVNVTYNTSSGYGGIYVLNSNTYFCCANGSNGNWFSVAGCWNTWNGGNPGYNGVAITTGYQDLYLRIDNVTTTNPTIGKIKDNGIYNANTFIEK